MIFKKKVCKVLLKPKKKNNYLVTIAIGKSYYLNWKKNYKKNWTSYCKKNNIGLIVFVENIIDTKNPLYKHPTWQRLLVPKYLEVFEKNVENICLMDADIVINPLSPDIFQYQKESKVNVVSLSKLPYKEKEFEIRKKIAFFRKLFIDRKYPIQSSLIAVPKDIYKNYKFKKKFDDYFCGGVLLLKIKRFSNIFLKTYYNYYNDQRFIGVDVPLNFELYSQKLVNLIDYKFQTIWLFELAYKFSFLYRLQKKKYYNYVKNFCVQQSLLDCYFLHFPGSWEDSNISNYIEKNFYNFQFAKLNNKMKYYKSINLKAKFHKKKIIFK